MLFTCVIVARKPYLLSSLGGAPLQSIKDVPWIVSDSAPAGVIEAAEIEAPPLPRGASNRHASVASGRSRHSAACALGVFSGPPGVSDCAAPMDFVSEAARTSGGAHGDDGVMGSPNENIPAPSKIPSRASARKVHIHTCAASLLCVYIAKGRAVPA